MFIVSSSGLDFTSDKIIHLVLDEITEYNFNLSNKIKGKKRNVLLTYNKRTKINKKRFKSYDTLVVHGGNIIRIWDALQHLEMTDIIKFFCDNRTYIGISAGGLILSDKSIILKDNIDYHKSILNRKFLGISKFYCDVHYDNMRNNFVYMQSLQRVSSKLDKPLFLLEDGSYIINDLSFIGNIWSTNGIIVSKIS